MDQNNRLFIYQNINLQFPFNILGELTRYIKTYDRKILDEDLSC